MKKNKNTELDVKEVASSKTPSKNNSKVSKTRTKRDTKVENLVPKNVTQVIKEDLVTVVNISEAKNEVKEKAKKKQKKNKIDNLKKEPSGEKSSSNTTKTQEELKVVDLAKIEKKKAKKLAQKLKKQQRKAANPKETENGLKSLNNEIKPEKKVQNKNTKSPKKGTNAEIQKQPSTNLKKIRKAEKKMQLKELKEIDEEPKKTRDPAALEVATVFVGNLPVNTKRIQLVRIFKDYGPVNAIRFRTAGGKLIMKHKQRKEAGTLNAYVVLKDAETAERAIALNGTEFKSNHLRVTRATKNAHNAGDVDAKHLVFVGNLKFTATDEKLREIFSSCGEIEYVRCLRDGEKGCKGVAYVCFKTPEAVGLALELNETVLDERPIHVERYSVKKLGAKQARDNNAAIQMTKKPATGAKKRLDKKNKKEAGKKSIPETDADKKKKTEFRGVKVDGIKKKQKKKKPTSQFKQLAKKIAPKTR